MQTQQHLRVHKHAPVVDSGRRGVFQAHLEQTPKHALHLRCALEEQLHCGREQLWTSSNQSARAPWPAHAGVGPTHRQPHWDRRLRHNAINEWLQQVRRVLDEVAKLAKHPDHRGLGIWLVHTLQARLQVRQHVRRDGWVLAQQIWDAQRAMHGKVSACGIGHTTAAAVSPHSCVPRMTTTVSDRT